MPFMVDPKFDMLKGRKDSLGIALMSHLVSAIPTTRLMQE